MHDLTSFQQHLASWSKDDWHKLFSLIPKIKQSTQFGDFHNSEKLNDGTIQMPFWVNSEVVHEFISVVYELELVLAFDWINWEEGRAILNNKSQDFHTLDSVTLCKLLTAIIRSDRFCDGYLVEQFEEGIIPKIIQALNHNIEV
jgi:hypothetical protein